MNLQSLAWLVTFLCILFSARIASAFLRHNPRLFTVMALFACAWTLVQGFYRAKHQDALTDLITDVASFLMVYAGSLLMLEGVAKQDNHIRTVPLQSVALVLLLVIAAPKEWSWTLPGGAIAGLNIHQTKAIVSYALILAALISIGLGMKGITSKRVFRAIAAFLVIYAATYGWQYYGLITGEPAPADAPLLSDSEYLLFASLKVIFTITFGCVVAYHGMTPDYKDKGWRYWVLHFFNFAGRSASMAKHSVCPLGEERCKPYWESPR